MPLIINADDFGLTQGVNDAVFELAALGSLSSTTVMVNMPFAGQAGKLAWLENFSVGLHFNLTEGRPIAPSHRVASLLDEEGAFYPNAVFRKRLSAGLIKDGEMSLELEAQFERLAELLGAQPSHIDSHQNIHKAPGVARVLMWFGREYSERKEDKRLGARAPARYLLLGAGDQSRAVASWPRSLRKMKLRRCLSELYLLRLSRQMSSVFAVPRGELYPASLRKLDLLQKLADGMVPGSMPESVFEIACHPAVNVQGLEGSKLTDQRVEEFQVMRGKTFIQTVAKWGMPSYLDISC